MTAHPGRAEASRRDRSPLTAALRDRGPGQVDGRYECAFDGVTLLPRHGQTTLCADLVDQSQLYGLLNRLRDLGIELVSVNAVAETTDAA